MFLVRFDYSHQLMLIRGCILCSFFYLSTPFYQTYLDQVMQASIGYVSNFYREQSESMNRGESLKMIKNPSATESINLFSFDEVLKLRKIMQKYYGMPMIEKTSSGFSIKAPIGAADSRFLEDSIYSLMVERDSV